MSLPRTALRLGLPVLAVLLAGSAIAASDPPVEGETVTVATTGDGAARGRPGSEPCLPVAAVVIDGVARLPAAAVRDAVAPRAVACIGNTSARAIVAAVNALYADRGYVATQAYVPPQDLARDPRLHITVVTGRVGRIDYREIDAEETLAQAWEALGKAAGPWDGAKKVSNLLATLDNALDRFQLLPPSWTGDLKARLTMPLDPGDVVEIDRIQQGIDQLNRVPSQKASAKLEAGDTPDTSTVIVTNPRADSFRLFAGYEINGNTLNGNGTQPANRARIDLFKDDLIGLNDAWAVSYAGGLDSNELRGSLSVPVRWLTLSLDGGYSEYLTPLSRYTDLFTKLYTGGLTASTTLTRDRAQQTAVEAALRWRRLDRFVNDQALGPQTITYVRLGLTHQRFFEDGQLVAGVGIDQGLAALTATRDPAHPSSDEPRAQFLKIDGSLSLARAIEAVGTLRLDVAGQWAGTPLYADDQLILGSVTTVRGFTRMPYRVDRGAYARGEFATALPMALLLGEHRGDLTFLDDLGSNLQVYAFTSFGGGRNIAERADVARGSVGGGVRYKYGRLNIDLTIAKPVYQIGIPVTRDTFKPEVYLVASAQIF